MDLSTLLQPLITIASTAIASGKSQAKSNSAATAVLDRSLGTIASIGVTILTYRVLRSMRASSRDGDRKEYETYRKRVFSTLRAVVQILIGEMLKNDDQVKVIKSDIEGCAGSSDESNLTMRLYHGSCHCKSISFSLSAPNHIRAKGSREGKIRFPNCSTTASEFKFTSGTEHLSVYYVNIPNQDDNKALNAIQVSVGKQVAAHTFCSRCGVHILRAPDNRSNALEVNTNCLDNFHDDKGERVDDLKLTVSFDCDLDGRGVGSGFAVKDQWSKEVDCGNDVDEIDTLYDDDSFTTNKSSRYRPGTPKTLDSTSYTAGDTLFSSSSSVHTSTTGMYDDDASRTRVLQSMRNNDSAFSPLPPNPSSTLGSPRSAVSSPITTTGSDFGTTNTTHSSLMREQLKYYMEKHISPSHRQDQTVTIHNGFLRTSENKD